MDYGIRWKVGNGKSICVWSDSWLDGPKSGCIISPRGNWLSDVTLDSFIDQDKKESRVKLVRATFLPFRADKIFRIPIGCLA